MAEKINTIVVGAGQAGLSMSEHLSLCGIEHVVLERSRVAEAWRSARWDSLQANGPAWHDRLPTMAIPTDPGVFPPKETIADYLVAYSEKIKAPLRTGVEVKAVRKRVKQLGFRVETSDGDFEAMNVIAATGPFQRPVIPPIVPEIPGLTQLHSYHYKNPAQLPEGAVMVVGAGASGAQIADELNKAGRKVYLSIGRHERPPRYYREVDSGFWSGATGSWDLTQANPDAQNVPIAISGVYPRKSLDFRRMAAEGVVLLGSTEGYANGRLRFEQNLQEHIEYGNRSYLRALKRADDYVDYNGLPLPEDPEAHNILPPTLYETDPVLELDPTEANLTSIVWATGFARDFSWIELDIFNENHNPIHHRGMSKEPGIYFLGLPFQGNRGSSFLFGVWHDAKYLAGQISIRNEYQNYLTRKLASLAGQS
ncbi:NAD(P)/FAD-dependent oxidoreductase [Bordetella sp. N]|uniref:flavin-containing monooxygenase n=1 Tax=Bordetella sp. N TaxID=1746199 RepID=UPI0007096AD7|nr:NAD(P)/FAD-dependent oxidoreductase [Bordetella sp. N]ALM85991.1 FAD-dependent oxidoreductase [Bordetella sp. N]